jgi:hypothetical protein
MAGALLGTYPQTEEMQISPVLPWSRPEGSSLRASLGRQIADARPDVSESMPGEHRKMSVCPYLKECAFVSTYVEQVKPHWNEFVKLYCNGPFQEVCQRLAWYQQQGKKPPAELMPTGCPVPPSLHQQAE